MIWNDMCGSLDIGISEYDSYVRFREPLGVLSARLWGADRIKQTSGTDADEERTAYEVLCVHLMNLERERVDTVDRKKRGVCGVHKTFLYGETVTAEPHYNVKMKVWLEPESESESETGQWQPQIIAEGDSAYGKWAFYAVEPETGKVGFIREGRTYTFDYTLPRGEWVNLRVEGWSGVTKLYAGGKSFFHGEEKEVDSIGSSEPFEEHATFVFPLQRIGKRTGSFDGELHLYVGYCGTGESWCEWD